MSSNVSPSPSDEGSYLAHTVSLRLQRLNPKTTVEVTLSPLGSNNTYTVTHQGRPYGKVMRFWGVPPKKGLRDYSDACWMWGAQFDRDPVKPCTSKAHAIRVLLVRGGLT